MSSATQAAATLDDLYGVEGKAELINGRIVHFMPTGFRPGRVGDPDLPQPRRSRRDDRACLAYAAAQLPVPAA